MFNPFKKKNDESEVFVDNNEVVTSDSKIVKENEHLIDERSTTIEKILLQEEHPNMSDILGVNLEEIFE